MTIFTLSAKVGYTSVSVPYVVYEHWIILGDGSEKIAYIGSCRFDELWNAPDAKHNDEWARHFIKGSPYTIKVIHISKTIDEAEALLVYEKFSRPVMPHCNAHGRTVQSVGRVKCNNGETYPSAYAASRALGISQPALSRHLRGKSGYRSIKGLTFTYVTE